MLRQLLVRNVFFCCGNDTNKSKETLHACQSQNCGKSIREIVDNSNNPQWKVQIANITAWDDFLAKDIVYHKAAKLQHGKPMFKDLNNVLFPPMLNTQQHFLQQRLSFMITYQSALNLESTSLQFMQRHCTEI